MTLRNTTFVFALTTILTACDSGSVTAITTNSDNDTNDENTVSESELLNLVGLLKIEPNSTDADFSRALFGRLETSESAQALEDYYIPPTDSCQFSRRENAFVNPPPEFRILDQLPIQISAGENVIVSSSAGTYATLNREIDDSGPIYKTNVQLIGSAPTGLTVDIPGDQFPAFSDIRIIDVPALQVTNPITGQNVTADTEFRWIPNNTGRSVFEINTSGPTGVNDEVIEVSCGVVDDGSFSFPESIRAEIGENYNDNWTSFLRIVYNVVQRDDAIVFTANSVRNQ